MTISCDTAADFFSDFGRVNFFFLLLPYRNMTLQVGPMEETERWIRRRGYCVLSTAPNALETSHRGVFMAIFSMLNSVPSWSSHTMKTG